MSSHTSQLNSFFQSFEYFLFVVKGGINSLQVLEGGSAISESEQLDPFSVWILELATEEEVLASSEYPCLHVDI